MTISTFNTGNEYTKNGQRIAAILTVDDEIIFVDFDRGIEGRYLSTAHSLTRGDAVTASDLRAVVTSLYVNGKNYDYARALHDDGIAAHTMRDLLSALAVRS